MQTTKIKILLLAALAHVVPVSANVSISGGTILGLVRPGWQAGSFRGFWFDAEAPVQADYVMAATSTEEVAISDGIYRRDYGPTLATNYTWSYTIAPNRPGPAETVSRYTSNAAVIIPDPTNETRWLWQGNGTATITLSSSGGTRALALPVTTNSFVSGTVDTFLNYAPASLRQALITAVDGRIAGKAPAQALRIYSTQDHAAATYTRNTSCWAADLDLSAISPWNSDGGNTKAGILISPRHILFAAHYQIADGATIRFVTNDSQVVTRTMTAQATLPGYVSYYPDISVGVLDSDVPGNISFARVLPDNYTTKLPGSLLGVPVLALDAEEKATINDLSYIYVSPGFYGAVVLYVAATGARLAFFEDKIGGDSGNPACLIVDGQLVLLNVWTFGGAGSGTNVTYWKSALNLLMTSLGGGYQLTAIDLSAYPTY
ncbi:MAG: hypothetical protein Q8J74_00795 [Candidatus Didemnitutus sp.]|nr:hypothetical protein [Candidatus Didemnitutus sp.]